MVLATKINRYSNINCDSFWDLGRDKKFFSKEQVIEVTQKWDISKVEQSSSNEGNSSQKVICSDNSIIRDVIKQE